jgi:hypothetical protein
MSSLDTVERSMRPHGSGYIAEKLRRLQKLAQEIPAAHKDVCKAQTKVAYHAIEVGRKLHAAHRLLAWLRTYRRRRHIEPLPPTWEQWVVKKCKMSVRTGYYYKRLYENRRIIEPILQNSHVSIRRLMCALAQQLDERDQQPLRPPQQEQSEPNEVDTNSETPMSGTQLLGWLEGSFLQLCEWFDEAASKWPMWIIRDLDKEPEGKRLFLNLLARLVEKADYLLRPRRPPFNVDQLQKMSASATRHFNNRPPRYPKQQQQWEWGEQADQELRLRGTRRRSDRDEERERRRQEEEEEDRLHELLMRDAKEAQRRMRRRVDAREAAIKAHDRRRSASAGNGGSGRRQSGGQDGQPDANRIKGKLDNRRRKTSPIITTGEARAAYTAWRYLARANSPRSAFTNRDSLPLVLISFCRAALKVAAGVLPAGLTHSFFSVMYATKSFTFIGCLVRCKTVTAAESWLGLPLAFAPLALVPLPCFAFVVVFFIRFSCLGSPRACQDSP